jgi:hypothetical protein
LEHAGVKGDNIKMNFKALEREGVRYVNVVYNMDRWRAVLSAVKQVSVSLMQGIS